NTASEKDRWDRGVTMQRKGAIRSIELQFRSLRQAFHHPLKCRITHTRGYLQVLFIRSTCQGKTACTSFRIVFRGIDERKICKLPSFIHKPLWLFKMKRHRSFCDFLSSDNGI